MGKLSKLSSHHFEDCSSRYFRIGLTKSILSKQLKGYIFSYATVTMLWYSKNGQNPIVIIMTLYFHEYFLGLINSTSATTNFTPRFSLHVIEAIELKRILH